MLNKVCIFGRIPPPFGGVTVSIKNYITALETKGIEVHLFSFRSLAKRYDLSHIHYSLPYKRFIAALIAKIISKKVIFTVHGNQFKHSNKINRWTLTFVDGVILLNYTIYCKEKEYFENHNIKTIVLTSILKEGLQLDFVNKMYFEKKPNLKYILVYAYKKAIFDKKDLYGLDFIIKNLGEFDDNYRIVILDPMSHYKTEIREVNSKKIIYIPKVVNFYSLLKQVDVYVRPTQTDGNSVAIQEALLLNIPVIASDVVSRPIGVHTYRNLDFSDFYLKLSDIKRYENSVLISTIEDYLNFCQNL